MPFLAKFLSSTKFYENSKKNTNSSTLQVKKATDFCSTDTEYYCKSNGTFPDAQPNSLIFFRAKKQFRLERASLSTHLCGIITVEASIILPFFILVIATILYLFNILFIQNSFQERLSFIARDFSQKAYITSALSSLSPDEQSQVVCEDNSILSDLGASVLSSVIVRDSFINSKLTQFVSKNYIKDDINGLYFSLTSYSTEYSTLLIVLNYEITIPFLPNFISLPITQTSKIDLYDGCSITPLENDTSTFVYICSSTNIYHTNKYCSYLLKYTSVRPISDSVEVGLPLCSFCDTYNLYNTDFEPKYIYLTELGGSYHTTLECNAFMRNVYRVKFEELNYTFNLCTRCEDIIQ